MTDIDTARLRALALAATPGKRAVAGSRILVDDVLGAQTWGPNWRNDQAYIAATDPATVIALLDEIERLRQWKSEAMDVLSEWEKTWIAAGRPGRLGTSKAAGVREEIERLRGAIRSALDFEAVLPAIATVPRRILTEALEPVEGDGDA